MIFTVTFKKTTISCVLIHIYIAVYCPLEIGINSTCCGGKYGFISTVYFSVLLGWQLAIVLAQHGLGGFLLKVRSDLEPDQIRTVHVVVAIKLRRQHGNSWRILS